MLIRFLSKLNTLQNRFTSHIFLYHSTYKSLPSSLEKGIHNVTPEVMYEQIKWLKKYFDIVDLDEIFNNGIDIAGKAAITFDDAYNSVFAEALPVLESLKTPCTIFVNGISLGSKVFWRDKIRYLINNFMIDDFFKFCPNFVKKHNISKKNFYWMTKNANVNSAEVNDLMDRYFEKRKIKIDKICYCVSDKNKLIDHPLITYGNHTYNHYVLSTLNEKEQDYEIGYNHNLLSKLNIKYSNIFSIPFGEEKDFNFITVEILKRYDYKGFLYSRGAINLNWKIQDANINGLKYRERYMLPTTFNSFQKLVFTMYKKAF